MKVTNICYFLELKMAQKYKCLMLTVVVMCRTVTVFSPGYHVWINDNSAY